MDDRDEFVKWVQSDLYEAELALHNGDAAKRRALWSRKEPVSVLGAWRNAFGQQEIDVLFSALGAKAPAKLIVVSGPVEESTATPSPLREKAAATPPGSVATTL